MLSYFNGKLSYSNGSFNLMVTLEYEIELKCIKLFCPDQSGESSNQVTLSLTEHDCEHGL